MKYNFDEIIDRRGTNSYKWDLVKEEDVIPMWVADMDFQTAPAIIETQPKRMQANNANKTKTKPKPAKYVATRIRTLLA